MDLWIRSQDREVLTRVVDIWKDADKNEIWAQSSFAIKNCLGIYKTEERALEVLDEIQEAKLGNFHYRCSNNAKVSSKEDTIIYEMPEK